MVGMAKSWGRPTLTVWWWTGWEGMVVTAPSRLLSRSLKLSSPNPSLPGSDSPYLPLFPATKQDCSSCCTLGRFDLRSLVLNGICNLLWRRDLDHHRVTVSLLVHRQHVDLPGVRLQVYLVLGWPPRHYLRSGYLQLGSRRGLNCQQ